MKSIDISNLFKDVESTKQITFKIVYFESDRITIKTTNNDVYCLRLADCLFSQKVNFPNIFSKLPEHYQGHIGRANWIGTIDKNYTTIYQLFIQAI